MPQLMPAALPTLRLLTCGSVDDGKSTLIGRMLYEKKLIFDDQLSTLARDSKKFGTTGEDIDYALLVDGLEAEREQGITIDVAYRYFATERRSFIVADTPGHEQFTRNMATGASNADLAIVLVDARKGLLTQTHRHSIIVSLLGVRHVVLAVNKIDLVDYQRERFSPDRSRLPEIRRNARLSLAGRAADLGPSRRQCVVVERAHALVVRTASARISGEASRSRRIAGARPFACPCNGSTGRIRIFAASPARSRADAWRGAIASSPPIRAVRARSRAFWSPTARSRPPKRATPSR